jgi:hypothetical protein
MGSISGKLHRTRRNAEHLNITLTPITLKLKRLKFTDIIMIRPVVNSRDGHIRRSAADMGGPILKNIVIEIAPRFSEFITDRG